MYDVTGEWLPFKCHTQEFI